MGGEGRQARAVIETKAFLSVRFLLYNYDCD